MESFGRMIAMMCGIFLLVVCLVFYRSAAVCQQRNDTVQSISDAFMQRTLRNKMVSKNEWDVFLSELSRFGVFRTELTMYERRQYEGGNGGVYLFTEKDEIQFGQVLAEGSYLRLVVTGEEKKKAEAFLFGGEFLYFTGGRIG